MSSTNLKSLTAAIAASIALVGCGGGGGGDSSGAATQSPDPIEFDKTYVSAADNGTVSLSGSFKTPDDIRIEQIPDIGIQVASFSNGTVELSIPDLDRPVTTQLSITVVVDGREVTKEISLLADNESAAADVAKAQAAIDQGTALLSLEQDAALYTFFVDYAYLAGAIPHSEKESLLADFNPQSAASYANFQLGLNNLDAVLEDYQAAEINETQLQQAISVFESAIADHSTYGKQKLDAISDYSVILVPAFVDGAIEYDSRLGIWSRYTVNSNYGDVVEGDFVAATAYAPIETFIRESVSQSLTCEVL